MTATVAPAPPIPYGIDRTDLDLWADRDGAVHSGDGPYAARWTRRLRRRVRPHSCTWWASSIPDARVSARG